MFGDMMNTRTSSVFLYLQTQLIDGSTDTVGVSQSK